jgi:hypothetical protein
MVPILRRETQTAPCRGFERDLLDRWACLSTDLDRLTYTAGCETRTVHQVTRTFWSSLHETGALLLCAITSLWLGLVACRHDGSALPLSGTLWAHLKDERFGTVTSTGGLPLGVRDALQELFHSPSLDIAEPGAEFQAAGGPVRPGRRLVAAGCSSDHCLVYYERAGTGPTWRVALFHWTPRETRFEWGGAAPGGLAGIGDVQHAVLSRTIRSPDRSW